MMLERDLLKLVLDYLKLHRILHWRQNVMGVKVSRAGKEHFYRTGFPGLPDVIAVYRGRCFGIELKGDRNEQSQAQRCFESDFNAAGGKYVLARRLEDVIEALK
jgi:hypothetical protein